MPIENADVYHYIYRINIHSGKNSGKYYYGKHSTGNLDDGYMGSGLIVKRSLKSGTHMTKDILCFCETSELAFELEELVVDEDMINNPNCLNLRTGGDSGYVLSDESRSKMAEACKRMNTVARLQTPEARHKSKKKQSESRIKLWKDPEYRARVIPTHVNPSRKYGYYVTPAGTFDNRPLAAKVNNCSPRSIYNWCHSNKDGFTFIQYK